MKLTASGGTDGASMVLFWPDNLPADADRMLQDDPIDLVEQLRDEGKLIWFPCDGDGGYAVSIFLNSAVPDPLRSFCHDEEHYPRLLVNGESYFGGMEFMFKEDRDLRDKYPHMCEKVVIPAGTYSASVYRTEVPESFHKRWLLEKCGTVAKGVWAMHGWLVGLSIVSVLASVVGVFLLPWAMWICLLSVTVVLVGSASLLSKTQAYKALAQARVEYEAAYPAYVVQIS